MTSFSSSLRIEVNFCLVEVSEIKESTVECKVLIICLIFGYSALVVDESEVVGIVRGGD